MIQTDLERPAKRLTSRQRLVLEFIIEHIKTSGYPPTIREIGDQMSIRSTNGVNDHLKALEKKGYLERQDAKSRALKPLFDGYGSPLEESGTATSQASHQNVEAIPVMGRIAAGNPIAAIESTEDFFQLDPSYLGRHAQGDVFALVVRGESMIEDGIHDGDYIFVRRQADAPDGGIVAAMIDGEATVKRIYREKGRIRLQPSNGAMEPIYVSEQQARETAILGRVVGVFRKLN